MALIDTLGLLLGAAILLVGLPLGAYFGGKWAITTAFKRRRGRRAKKLVGLVAIVVFFVALLGLIYVLFSGVATKTSAYPILTISARVVSSPWTYVVVGLYLLRKVIVFRRSRYARQAAALTGIGERSIKQLAAEARSPDGTTRVVATVNDSVDEIERRIREALETGEDDTLTPALPAGDTFALARDAASNATALAGVLDDADLPEEYLEHSAGVDHLGDEFQEESDGDDLNLRQEIKHFRLDLASAINFSNIAWQFALPAGLTSLAVLSLLGVWVGLLWYPVIALLGAAVGAANYYRHRRRDAKTLDSLRDDVERNDWGLISVLVKEAETDETIAYYGWLAGRRYAAYDRDQFVEELAERASQKLNQGYAAPSIMEKNAEQLADYYPDLAGFEDQERSDIQLELVDRVRESQYGLVPKQKLIEDVIEHRLDEYAGGIYREGLGYDPQLVREAYDDLTPGYLTEVGVTVDTDDGERELVAVESTQDPLPVDRAQIRSEFSALFREYASRDARYDLPDSPSLDLPPHRLEPRNADDVAVAVATDGGEHV